MIVIKVSRRAYFIALVAVLVDVCFFLSALIRLFILDMGLGCLLFLSASGALTLGWWLFESPEKENVKTRPVVGFLNTKKEEKQ